MEFGIEKVRNNPGECIKRKDHWIGTIISICALAFLYCLSSKDS